MAYFLGGDFGGSTVESTISDAQKGYDPVYADEVSGEFIWQLLPSAYRALMDDREVFTHSWEAMIRTTSGLMLDAWQAGASYSLKDIPVHQQRKWILYDLIKTETFTKDPGLTTVGVSNRLEWDGTYFRLDGSWVNRRGHDKSTTALNGSSTQDGSLSWSVTASFSEVSIWSGAQFGYFSSTDKNAIANALVVGAVADGDGVLFPFVGHYSQIGVLTSTTGSWEMAIDTEYSFEASYEAKDGILTLTLHELEAEKATGTEGECDSTDSSDIYTAGFSDSSQDFDDDGVVAGDTLIIDTDEYEIVTVAGGTLVVASSSLPAGSSGITYSIVGKLQRTSVSLDLPNLAGDPTFTVDQFGTAAIDLRYVSDGSGGTLFGGSIPTKARRKALTGYTDTWIYFDPTVEETLLSAPILQDQVTTPEVYLYEGTDFEVVGSAFQFKEPPASAMWAEYSTYDEDVLYNNFGAHVGLGNEESSATYRSKVRGLYYAYYQGPTPSSIKAGVQILLGLPIAEEAGEVDSINEAYSGDYGELTIDGTGYLYPLLVGTSLVVGDEVKAFQPLCDGVQIKDYLSRPEWFIHFDLHEVEKFHTFAVFLNIDAFDIEDLSGAASFVETIKPTWKSALFVVHKDVTDEVDLDDELKFVLALNLYDIPCDEPPLVAYDDAIYEGEEADWKYDQGVDEWGETSAAMRETGKDYTSAQLQGVYSDSEVRYYLTGTATLTNGSGAGAGVGTAWTTEIGSGALTNTYVAVALQLSGADGVATSGSNTFTDTVTGFAGVEDGDMMTIDGTEYEVQSVDSSTEVTLDAPLTDDDTGVAWLTTGQLKIWGEVSNVGADDALTFNTVFGGSDGVYQLTLLDPDYREAFHDQFLEQCPEEEFTFVVDLSVGYGEDHLTGRSTFTEFSAGVEGNGNVEYITELGLLRDSGSGDGDTDSPGSGPITFTVTGENFLTSIPNGGAATPPTNLTRLKIGAVGYVTITEVTDDENLKFAYDADFAGLSGEDWEVHDNSSTTDKFIVARDGTWHEVTSIIDNDSIQVTPVATEDQTLVRAYIAANVLSDTLLFANSSGAVVCSSDLSATGTGELAVGDWIQSVPGGEPVAEILTISGVNITLTSSYSGNSGTTQAIRRDGVLPLAVGLPSGSQNFTDWNGTAGGQLSDTVAEPI